MPTSTLKFLTAIPGSGRAFISVFRMFKAVAALSKARAMSGRVRRARHAATRRPTMTEAIYGIRFDAGRRSTAARVLSRLPAEMKEER
jgi:hypothetical protein